MRVVQAEYLEEADSWLGKVNAAAKPAHDRSAVGLACTPMTSIQAVWALVDS